MQHSVVFQAILNCSGRAQDLFAVGQFVGSTIIGLSENDGARSRKRIELSLRLRHVNTGQPRWLQLWLAESHADSCITEHLVFV